MAQLVEIIGINHAPQLPGILRDEAARAEVRQARDDYELMRRKMSQAQPQVLVVIGHDHLNQWFMDNMPAFSIGKAIEAEGPFPHEQRMGVAPYRAKVEVDLAKFLIQQGSRLGVDFAFSDEFTMDHAFTVGLNFIRPEADLPIVPIWTNVMAPPVPSASRFYQVGQALCSMIEAYPVDKRIGVLSTGHLSVEIGGPKSGRQPADREFDNRMMALIGEGDWETVVREATWERLLQAGNAASGFLNFVLLLGLAQGTPPTASGAVYLGAKFSGSTVHMAWDLHVNGGPA